METFAVVKDGKIDKAAVYYAYASINDSDSGEVVRLAVHADIVLCLLDHLKQNGLPDKLQRNGVEILRLIDWLGFSVSFGATIDADAAVARWRTMVEAMATPKLPLLASRTTMIQREVLDSMIGRDRTIAAVEYALAAAAGKPFSDIPREEWSIELILAIPDELSGVRGQLLRAYGARQEIGETMSKLVAEIDILATMR